jgi:hypothetical protein
MCLKALDGIGHGSSRQMCREYTAFIIVSCTPVPGTLLLVLVEDRDDVRRQRRAQFPAAYSM